MDFRWVALIALWTLLAGPIFAGTSAPSGKTDARPASVKARTLHSESRAVKP
jgi:hypothetical protein